MGLRSCSFVVVREARGPGSRGEGFIQHLHTYFGWGPRSVARIEYGEAPN
jgi:hypothetical protein